MFGIDTDYNPITPTGDALLTELGIDIPSVRETLADDRVRRCPDAEVPENGSGRVAREE